jgi:hypothetical protein
MEFPSLGACLRANRVGTRDFPIGIGIFHCNLRGLNTGGVMERDIAIRLDGMLLGVRGNLDGIAHYMKNNLSDEEYAKLIKSIGQSMSSLVDLSTSLYSRFPDILPAELRPPGQS